MNIAIYLLAIWAVATFLIFIIGYLNYHKSEAQEKHEYFVEFKINDVTLCQFGIIASSPHEAAQIVEKDTGGTITQVAIRRPEEEGQDGLPIYEITPHGENKDSK